MLTAAIYARKSTEQNGVADEQRSVTRQIDHARQFAERRGWMVAEEHIYVDDGISGAEFERRPGLLRLMNAADDARKRRTSTFQALIVSDLDRLGREQLETGWMLKKLSVAGVKVFTYLNDSEVLLDSPVATFIMQAQAFGATLERDKARQRTHDALQRRARSRHVTGGRVFGYDNVDVPGPDGTRSHVQRRINGEQAAVIRRIFELCARGRGTRRIAKTLNDDHAPAPRAQQGRPKAWAPSTVREVLHRELYRGRIVWNTTRKRDQWGQVRPSRRPVEEWITTEAPELRIVPDALWEAAHDRLNRTRDVYLRATNGRLWGRPETGLESKYLLTGLARCGQCGGTMTVRSRGNGARGNRRQRSLFYACSSFHHRGKAVCANNLEMRLADADNAVLGALERELLDPDILQEAMRRAIAKVGDSDVDPSRRQASLTTALEQVTAELDRLTAAVAAGADLPTLVTGIRERERRKDALLRELAELNRPRVRPLPPAKQQQLLESKLSEWRELLRANAPKARQMLRKLIDGRIVFNPETSLRRYRFVANGTMSQLLSGLVDPQAVASPNGPAIDYQPLYRGIWVSDRPAA
jgi:site-specific DNA recombinase